MSACGKRLGCLLTTGLFGLVVGGRFSDETDNRGGVPGKLKWMVLGRKREAMKTVMLGKGVSDQNRAGVKQCDEGRLCGKSDKLLSS